MMSLIRRTFGGWLRQEKNSIKRVSKPFDSFHVSDKMRDRNTVNQHFLPIGGHYNLAGLDSHLPNPVHKPKGCNAFEIDEWRRRCGFLGHNGIPCLWDDTQERWLPVTESSYASAYAALQKQISVK
jgi:hypothetical protein